MKPVDFVVTDGAIDNRSQLMTFFDQRCTSDFVL